ncbi:MAG TPA: hypothetical protein VFD70_09300 [Anaerolineae bacterium]|nr:hypothetical protein [Anaerolineae bacterium]
MLASSSPVPIHPPESLRHYLSGKFKEIEQRGDNIISLKTNIPYLFKGITSPNEFSGPLVEAWAHIQLAKCFEEYKPAVAGRQEFADASAEYQGQRILINIKAKAREMENKSRINLSSLGRYREHYSKSNPSAFYILVCQYQWHVSENELKIVIEEFKYVFNLLDIPPANFRLEGAFEGSYRVFIAPIPPEAMIESTTYSTMSPSEFLQILEQRKIVYDNNKRSRGITRNRT